MTTIREFTDPIHAGMVLSYLQDNEIEASLADENASAWIAARNLVPIRLQVQDSNVEKAIELLKAFDEAPLAGN